VLRAQIAQNPPNFLILPSGAASVITYEYPLNERIRTLLRLEDLFERSRHFIARTDPHDHHMALLTLFEIMEVSSRADLKSDLLQELERQKQVLLSFREATQRSRKRRWRACCATSSRRPAALFSMTGKIGQYLRENDWLMSIKQRTGIPGGACEFDLPPIILAAPAGGGADRRSSPHGPGPLHPLRDGTGDHSCASCGNRASRRRTMRRSAPTSRCSAARRRRCCACVSIPKRPACRKISATTYVLNIRFLAQNGDDPRQRIADWDVGFELTFCNL